MLHQIGAGTLGPVFRTYEPSRDRLVAVKVFRLDVPPEQARALADELEAVAARGLAHPSIVAPLAAGVEGTLPYLAAEYIAAESLDVALRHYAPAALDTALPFIAQLAGAIDFARAAGVGHGALHPRDIFVTPDEARATGFGVVDALERLGLRAPVRRPYSAPERIAGGRWGAPADVFSLAAIAHELITGRRAAGTGDQIGPLGVKAGEHAEALRRVLAAALDDDPARRPPSALAFAAALESAARVERTDAAAIAVEVTPPRADFPVEEPEASTEPEEIPAVHAVSEDDVAPMADAGLLVDAVDEIDGPPPIPPTPAESATPLFDLADREPAADLRIFNEEDEADVQANAAPEAAAAPASGREAMNLVHDGGLSSGGERSRPAMLPIALTAVICTLAGFVAGYGLGSRERAAAAPDAVVGSEADRPAGPAGTPAQGGRGQAWSDQAVEPGAAKPAAPPAATDAPPPVSARLQIRSTPSNAGVVVNGTWRGRTPLTLGDLAFGEYAVRVVEPGYEPATERVALSAATPSRELTFALERPPAAARPSPPPTARRGQAAPPAASAGTLVVDSRPAGARVFVDGKPVGVTPVRLPGLSAGSHVVRLELAGYRSVATSERIVAGRETRVAVSLERVSTP